MTLQAWSYSTANWPPTFGRMWLWTMFGERAHHERVLEIAAQIGATDVICLVSDSPKPQPRFAFRPNRDSVLELAQKVKGAGLDWHLGAWLDPKPEYVNEAAAALKSMAIESKASSLCIDAEGEWKFRINNHIEFVAHTVAPAFKGFPIPIGVTSYASLPKEVAPLLAWVVAEHDGFGMPQVYGVDTGQDWQKLASAQPDTIAALGYRTWSPITKNLVAVVAAYGTPQAGWNAHNALQAQLLRSEYEGFAEVAAWVEEALAGAGPTATTRREVLSEVEITGDNTVIKTGLTPRMLLGVGALATAATGALLTRRKWVPALLNLFRRGG